MECVVRQMHVARKITRKTIRISQGRKTDGRVDRDWKCFVVALIMPRSVLCVICVCILLALWKMTNVHMQWRKRAHNELRKIFWLWVMNTNLWSIIIIHVSSEYRMEMTANQNTSAGEMQAQRNMSTRCVCVYVCESPTFENINMRAVRTRCKRFGWHRIKIDLAKRRKMKTNAKIPHFQPAHKKK